MKKYEVIIYIFLISILLFSCKTIDYIKSENYPKDIEGKIYTSYKNIIVGQNLNPNDADDFCDLTDVNYNILINDFEVVNNKGLIISFWKENKLNHKDGYGGILYYSFKNQKSLELYKQKDDESGIYLNNNVLTNQCFFYVYEKNNFVKYEIDINNFAVIKKEILANFKLNDKYEYCPIENSEYFYVKKLNPKNSSEDYLYIVDENNKKVFESLEAQSIFFNVYDKYFYYNYGYIFRINENNKKKELYLEYEKSLYNPHIIITNVLALDKKNRYLFFEGISMGEYRYIGCIDTKEKGNVYDYKVGPFENCKIVFE